MTQQDAWVYILERAIELAKLGWRVKEVSESRYVMVKTYPRPHEDRIVSFEITDAPWGKSVKNSRSGRPKHCELCGTGKPDMDTTDKDDDFMVVCNQCATAHGLSPRGIYEWGWVDYTGPSGCSGAGVTP